MININKLINTLILKTKTENPIDHISWSNLRQYCEIENNEPLRKYIVAASQNYYSKKAFTSKFFLDEYSSYIADINNGTITVLTYQGEDEQYYILCAQSSPNNRIIDLNIKQEYQDSLYSLVMSIKENDDNIEKFIESIIE